MGTPGSVFMPISDVRKCFALPQVKLSEKAALNVHSKISNQSLPIRQYLVGYDCHFDKQLAAMHCSKYLNPLEAYIMSHTEHVSQHLHIVRHTSPTTMRPVGALHPPLQEATVVPVLMQGLQSVCKERPENPVEYLAYYLLQHNPQKGSTQPPPPQPQPTAPAPQSAT